MAMVFDKYTALRKIPKNNAKHISQQIYNKKGCERKVQVLVKKTFFGSVSC